MSVLKFKWMLFQGKFSNLMASNSPPIFYLLFYFTPTFPHIGGKVSQIRIVSLSEHQIIFLYFYSYMGYGRAWLTSSFLLVWSHPCHRWRASQCSKPMDPAIVSLTYSNIQPFLLSVTVVFASCHRHGCSVWKNVFSVPKWP